MQNSGINAPLHPLFAAPNGIWHSLSIVEAAGKSNPLKLGEKAAQNT